MTDQTKDKRIPKDAKYEDLLVPIFKEGKKVYHSPDLEKIREHGQNSLSRFSQNIKRFLNPHVYEVGMEKKIHEIKIDLIKDARKNI